MHFTHPRLQPLTAEALTHIQLIATDMDGTLTQAGKFTPSLLHSLITLASAQIPVIIVTGRSAGWVQGLVSYLPVAGAIAENGGLFYHSNGAAPDWLVPIADLATHRQRLADLFYQLQAEFPQLHPSSDNPFRLTDWTFDIQELSTDDLIQLSHRCREQGWGFTYSTIQCHIKLAQQDKAIGLTQVLQSHFPQVSPTQVLTVGDSPNDESLFNPQVFPCSVGVANILSYVDRLTHQPAFVTSASEAEGFQALADLRSRL